MAKLKHLVEQARRMVRTLYFPLRWMQGVVANSSMAHDPSNLSRQTEQEHVHQLSPAAASSSSPSNRLDQAISGSLDIDDTADLLHHAKEEVDKTTHDQVIADIFLSLYDDRLTQVKLKLASMSSHRLLRLIFEEIADENIRETILEHFKQQASLTDRLQIMSDIDDTFFPGFYDKRFPFDIVYPGVRQLYRELDADTSGDIIFITARPSLPFGLQERIWTRPSLQKAGLEQFEILSGSIRNINNPDAMAVNKADSLIRCLRLFPEFKTLFIGDSGQGDVEAGRRIREYAPQNVPLVLIHEVTGHLTRAIKTNAEKLDIIYFDTYVAAALAAHQYGLISLSGLLRVIDKTIEEFEEIEFDTSAQKEATSRLLKKDLENANKYLMEKSTAPQE